MQGLHSKQRARKLSNYRRTTLNIGHETHAVGLPLQKSGVSVSYDCDWENLTSAKCARVSAASISARLPGPMTSL